ncbi:MAG: arginase family protein [Candidatus Heimdallarchaeota archaeon]
MDSYPEDEKYTRATVLRRIMELDYFNTKNYYFIGCRGHNLGLEEVTLIKDKGMTKIEAQEFSNVKSIEKKLSEIAAKHNSLYVSLDIDVLDPAFAPGVSVPEPGGLSTRELISIIRLLAKKIKCFELVEVNPTKDINDITSLVACKIIFELMDAKA